MLGMAGLTWFLLRRVRFLGKDVSVDEHGGQKRSDAGPKAFL